MMLAPLALSAQHECGVGLLDRIYVGMKSAELDSIVRADPCRFARPEYGADYRRPGLRELPVPSTFRVDFIEYRTFAEEDTTRAHVIFLKGSRVAPDQASQVPLQLRSLIDQLIARFGAPTYIEPDELVNSIPVARPPAPDSRSYGSMYARWRFHDQVLIASLVRSYKGWQIEVRLEEVEPADKG